MNDLRNELGEEEFRRQEQKALKHAATRLLQEAGLTFSGEPRQAPMPMSLDQQVKDQKALMLIIGMSRHCDTFAAAGAIPVPVK